MNTPSLRRPTNDPLTAAAKRDKPRLAMPPYFTAAKDTHRLGVIRVANVCGRMLTPTPAFDGDIGLLVVPKLMNG